MNRLYRILSVSLLVASDVAFAAGGGAAEIINYYSILLANLGLGEHAIMEWAPVCGAVLGFCLLALVGKSFQRHVEHALADGIPDGKVSLGGMIEAVCEFVYNFSKDVIGEKQFKPFLPLLFALFFFILFNNLSGLVPGFPPATESLNTNLAMGIVVFFVYNAAGVKEHGLPYFKHFLGPIWWLAWLLLPIELVAHFARPISLSLRLYGNLFGDHLVLSVFTGLTKLVIPSIFLFLGLLVACLQSFVFTLLSSIYISLSVSHDH